MDDERYGTGSLQGKVGDDLFPLQFDVFDEARSGKRDPALIDAPAVCVHEKDVVPVAEAVQQILAVGTRPRDADGSRTVARFDQFGLDHGAWQGRAADRDSSREVGGVQRGGQQHGANECQGF